MAASISGLMLWYCAFRSRSGILTRADVIANMVVTCKPSILSRACRYIEKGAFFGAVSRNALLGRPLLAAPLFKTVPVFCERQQTEPHAARRSERTWSADMY